MDQRDLVLWDGECGFCGRCVAWGQRHDLEGRLDWVAYQKAPSPPMTPELERACAQAVHLICGNGEVYSAGRAVLKVLEIIGWRRTGRVLAMPPMLWIVEILYRVVAANRMFFSRFLFRNETTR